MAEADQSHSNKLFVAFLIAMFVILCLILYIIFGKPSPDLGTDSKQTRDSITLLTNQIEDQKKITDHYLGVVDSLKRLPPILTIIYREQKKFTSLATIDQLDSIIRTNSGLKPRVKRY